MPVRLLRAQVPLQRDAYEDFKKTVAKYPTTNPAGYETACYLRHLAMAAARLCSKKEAIPTRSWRRRG